MIGARVGINTDTPSTSLDVAGNVHLGSFPTDTGYFLGADAAGYLTPIGVSGGGGGGTGGSDPWEADIAGIDYASGNVGINNTAPAYSLDVGGTVRAYNYLIVSDRRQKQDVTNVSINSALTTMANLKPVTFNWSRRNKDVPSTISGKDDMGLLAQDVQKILPNLVHRDNDGSLAVEYKNIFSPLVAALVKLGSKYMDVLVMQEHIQEKEIQQRQDEIDTLQEQITTAEAARGLGNQEEDLTPQ